MRRLRKHLVTTSLLPPPYEGRKDPSLFAEFMRRLSFMKILPVRLFPLKKVILFLLLVHGKRGNK